MRDATRNVTIKEVGQQVVSRRAQAALIKLRARIARRPGRWRRRMNRIPDPWGEAQAG